MRRSFRYIVITLLVLIMVSCKKGDAEDHSLDGTYNLDHIYSISNKTDYKPSDLKSEGSKLAIQGKGFELLLNYQNGTINISGNYIIKKDNETMMFYDSDDELFASGALIKNNDDIDVYLVIDGVTSFMYCFKK